LPIRFACPIRILWGHVRFGQAVLNLHHLVLHDPYSYSAPGHYWNNHEWLSEVLMAAVFADRDRRMAATRVRRARSLATAPVSDLEL